MRLLSARQCKPVTFPYGFYEKDSKVPNLGFCDAGLAGGVCGFVDLKLGTPATNYRPYTMEHSMLESWSANTIEDETYRKKFIDVPNILADWLRDHGGLAGRDVLDFGCGEATMALGIALQHGARRVVGVEIHEEIENALPYAKTQLGLERLPDNLELIRLHPDSPLDAIGTFDVVYSWSVFEHVSQDLIIDCFTKIKRVLRPNGVMFLQTTPLFYSAEGSHMKPWVPAPWAHLTMQQDAFYATLRKRTDSRDQAYHLQWVYETLNRVTAPQLLRAVKQAGFEVVREYRTHDEVPVPEDLKEIYAEDVLTTNQLVFLAKHRVELEDGITPELHRNPQRTEYSIDQFGPSTQPFHKAVEIHLGEDVKVSGWAIDVLATTLAGGVEIVIDGHAYKLPYSLSRPDVAIAKGKQTCTNSGFSGTVSPAFLPKGSHTVFLRIVSADRKTYYQTPEFPVVVTASALQDGITPRLPWSSQPARTGAEVEASHAQAHAAMILYERLRKPHRFLDGSDAQAEAAIPPGDRGEAEVADLSKRYEKVRTSLDEAQANLARARAEIGQRDETLAAMQASRSWRVTKPLRLVMSAFRKLCLSFRAR